MLKENITSFIATAMKEHNHERLETLKMIKAQLINLEKSGTAYTEEAEIKVLMKMVSAHEDSIKQFTAAGRTELAEHEKAELDIIKEFIPEQPSDEEIAAYTENVVNEYVSSLADPASFSMAHMKNILEKVKAKYNTPTLGKIVSQVVKSKL